jgi:P-type Ca2+ transporter type 2C
MTLAKLFVLKNNSISTIENGLNDDKKTLVRIAMWASEPTPFDPMEIALHDAYSKLFTADERQHFSLHYEYALSGIPPMMTHIFEDKSGNRIVAAKGAPEAIIKVCSLSDSQIHQINQAVTSLSSEGYRVLWVAESEFSEKDFPETQQEIQFSFIGVVAFYDPPKKNIQATLEKFNKAGITVKIITGDNTETTKSIAKQVNFKGLENSIEGKELMKLSDGALNETVMNTQIFTRMFPDAKLKIINALKSQHQIVAMTGDGVNDGPALKAAHIGIAMGKKGTEIAKEAASLILMNDDLSKMVDAVGMGRRIYTNLKKAIQFIISIHVPIILTVFIPLAFGWIYPNIFSPLHIIFLELVMGPTCSIVFENEPMEKNAMSQPPRPYTTTFFSWKELSTSILQGLIITVGTLFTYQYSVQNAYNEHLTRSMVFTTLITANVFLTLVNRSFYYSFLTTIKYKNDLVLLIIVITIALTGLLLYVDPFTNFFELEHLEIAQLRVCICVGFISVIWIELVKWWNRKIKI